MTYRIAKARVVTFVEALTDLYLPDVIGRKYKHDETLDPEDTAQPPPGKGRVFCISTREADTNEGNYIRGWERTRSASRLSVWVPSIQGRPSKFDDACNTVYEEIRSALLDRDNWDDANSTIVCIGGPGGETNINLSIEPVDGDEGQPLGAWVHHDFYLEHREVAS